MRRRGRPRIVVTATFPVYPAQGGGQLRCLHLLRGLAESYDVELVSLAPVDFEPARLSLADGLTEISIPKSRDHQAAEWEIEAATETPVTDVVAADLMRLTPVYTAALSKALDGAACVLPSHPFLHPLTDELRPDLPVVYDAHNVEFQLKEPPLGASPVGRMLLRRVKELEGGAIRAARLVTVCTEGDGERLQQEFGPFPQVVVPNGVAVAATPFVDLRDRRRLATRWLANVEQVSGRLRGTRSIALFVGSWHPPNVGAVESIVQFAAGAAGDRVRRDGQHRRVVRRPRPPAEPARHRHRVRQHQAGSTRGRGGRVEPRRVGFGHQSQADRVLRGRGADRFHAHGRPWPRAGATVRPSRSQSGTSSRRRSAACSTMPPSPIG